MLVYDPRPVYPLGVLQGNQSYPPIEDIIKELQECSSKAQHGGTMTTLVELALKEGFIDSAVLTRSKKWKSLQKNRRCRHSMQDISRLQDEIQTASLSKKRKGTDYLSKL